MSNNETITMTKSEMINLLISAYVAGVDTVKEVVRTSVQSEPEELYKMFEARFNFYEAKKNEQG